MAPRIVITFAPAVALSAMVAVLLQLNGILPLWKIKYSRQGSMLQSRSLCCESEDIIQNLKRRMQRYLNRRNRSCWHKPGWTELWWQNIWIGVAPEECRKENFRMSRAYFMNLVSDLRPYISPNSKSPNHRALSAEKKVAVASYFLKDTAPAAVSEFCKAISNYLDPKYLHLPKDEESMKEKVAEFEATFGMTQAFCCIDGMHIPF